MIIYLNDIWKKINKKFAINNTNDNINFTKPRRACGLKPTDKKKK